MSQWLPDPDAMPASQMRKLRALRLPGRCDYQGKFMYRSAARARKAERLMRTERNRPYRCPHCGNWHLTSGDAEIRDPALIARPRNDQWSVVTE